MPQVLHSTEVVVAALSFAGDLMRLRGRRRSQVGSDAGVESADEDAGGTAAGDASAQAAAGADAAAQAVGQPHSLRERVLQAFSTHDLPVHKPLSLPTLSVELACPGAPTHADVLAAQHRLLRVRASIAKNAIRMPVKLACPGALALMCLWVVTLPGCWGTAAALCPARAQ